jgi:Polyketide cyclase / dehydrase and lipid transport
VEPQIVAETVDVSASPDQVWAVIGTFGDTRWHPLIAHVDVTGAGIGQLRIIETIDGKQIIKRLDAIDDSQRIYRYATISGLPVADYIGTLDVKPNSGGSSVEWRAQYLADGQPDIVVRSILSGLFKTGLGNLKSRFGPLR